MSSPERQVDSQWSPAGPEAVVAEAAAQTKGANLNIQPAQIRALPNSSREFWTELNATMDEFFAVIGASKERMAELSAELVKRDSLITLLEAQNGALRARLGIAESGGAEKRVSYPARPSAPAVRESVAPAVSAAAPRSAAPEGPGPAPGLWSKLKNLEREI